MTRDRGGLSAASFEPEASCLKRDREISLDCIAYESKSEEGTREAGWRVNLISARAEIRVDIVKLNIVNEDDLAVTPLTLIS